MASVGMYWPRVVWARIAQGLAVAYTNIGRYLGPK